MIAFVFPGQGAQYVGMGTDLADRFPAARRVFEEASDACGLDLLTLCREGPEDRLRETENTQPAILVSSWAAATVLMEHGVVPAMAAGLSLGEYTAMVAAGVLTLGEAAAVVRQRGRFMQEAAEGRSTAMVAVVGLDADRVAEICRGVPGIVEAANHNAPGQVVIGGEADAVALACDRLREAGARRLVRLAVSAPFHTSLMRPAAERLAGVLEEVPVRPARIPVVSNVTAQPVREPEAVRSALIAQVAAPVRWEESVRTLASLGARIFVEAGPGTTLAGLIRRTLPTSQVISVGDVATLEAAVASLPLTRSAPGSGGA